MSATFNGSTSYLFNNNEFVGNSPIFPVMIGFWFKPFSLAGTRQRIFSINNNDQINTYAFEVHYRPDLVSDPLLGMVLIDGVLNGTGQIFGINSANIWYLVVLTLNTGVTNRRIYLNLSTVANNWTGTVSGLIQTSIGGQYTSSGLLDPFNGRIAEFFIANTHNHNHVLSIITELFTFKRRPINISQLRPFLRVYQPLYNNINNAGYIGPDNWVNNNVTFVPGDHPIIDIPPYPTIIS